MAAPASGTVAGGAASPCCGAGLRRDAVANPGAACGSIRPAPHAKPVRIVRLHGGRFRVGTDASPLPQDGEGPPRPVNVRPFVVDPYAVTNGWFAQFVAETGYLTDAERFGWSLVFQGFVHGVSPAASSSGSPSWWRRIEGACWRHPEGLQSDVHGRLQHPVVHVSWNDAVAFVTWAGGRLPTEAEWEFAACGGLTDARFPWGSEEPDDHAFQPCNIWQGDFPSHNSCADGFAGTAPVDAFAPNGFGLFNMVGNTWEWCADSFRIRSLARAAKYRNEAARAAGDVHPT